MSIYKKLVGKIGEDLAVYYLLTHKHKVIARNIYIGKNEIDIISTKSNTVFLIEVKTSFNNYKGIYNVSNSKVHNLTKAYFKYMKCSNYRFVIIDVNLNSKMYYNLYYI